MTFFDSGAIYKTVVTYLLT